VLWAAIGFAASVLLVGLSRAFPLAFAFLLLAGLSAALNAIITNTILQTTAPDHLRGQVVGLYAFIVVGMAPIGSLQAGWFAEHLGADRAVMLGGAVCLVAAGAGWRMLSRSAGSGRGRDSGALSAPGPEALAGPPAPASPGSSLQK
jgi:MFS family permease